MLHFTNNMKNIFDTYKTALPEDFEGYYKGDLLYYSTPPINSDGYFEFTPNIVTYQVKQDSALGAQKLKHLQQELLYIEC